MVDKSVLEARFSPNVGFYSRNNKLSDSEYLKGINRRRKERSGGEMGMWRRKRGKEGRRKRRMLVKHLVCARHFRYFIPPIFPAPHCNNKIYVIIFISQMVKLKFKDVKLMCHVTQQCVADPGFKPISA